MTAAAHADMTLEEALAEIERLNAVINGDATVVGLHLEKHGLDLGIQHPLVHVMANALANMLGDSNYVEMQMKSQSTGDEYLVHLQRLARPTPHELRKRAEAKYDELILAVGKKYPDESRHETALRYIRQAEIPSADDMRPCAAPSTDTPLRIEIDQTK
jgi:hypothetical protein